MSKMDDSETLSSAKVKRKKKLKLEPCQPSSENCGLTSFHGMELPYVIRGDTRYFIRNHLRLVFSQHRSVTAAHFGVMCNSMCHSEICTPEEKAALIWLSAKIKIEVKNSSRLISETDSERAYSWMVSGPGESRNVLRRDTDVLVKVRKEPRLKYTHPTSQDDISDKRPPKKRFKKNNTEPSTEEINKRNREHFKIGSPFSELSHTWKDSRYKEQATETVSESDISPESLNKGRFLGSLQLQWGSNTSDCGFSENMIQISKGNEVDERPIFMKQGICGKNGSFTDVTKESKLPSDKESQIKLKVCRVGPVQEVRREPVLQAAIQSTRDVNQLDMLDANGSNLNDTINYESIDVDEPLMIAYPQSTMTTEGPLQQMEALTDSISLEPRSNQWISLERPSVMTPGGQRQPSYSATTWAHGGQMLTEPSSTLRTSSDEINQTPASVALPRQSTSIAVSSQPAISSQFTVSFGKKKPVGIPSWTAVFNRKQPHTMISNFANYATTQQSEGNPTHEVDNKVVDCAPGWEPDPALIEAMNAPPPENLATALDLSTNIENVSSHSEPSVLSESSEADTKHDLETASPKQLLQFFLIKKELYKMQRENALLKAEMLQMAKEKSMLVNQLVGLRVLYHKKLVHDHMMLMSIL